MRLDGMRDIFWIWAEAVVQRMAEAEDRAFMGMLSDNQATSESDKTVEIIVDLGMNYEFDFSKLKEDETVSLGGEWKAVRKSGIVWINGPLVVSPYMEPRNAEREALLDHKEGFGGRDLPSRG